MKRLLVSFTAIGDRLYYPWCFLCWLVIVGTLFRFIVAEPYMGGAAADMLRWIEGWGG